MKTVWLTAFYICVAGFGLAQKADAASSKVTICWIDHVEKTNAGVNVYFIDMKRMFVNIFIKNRNIGYTLRGDGKLVPVAQLKKPIELDHLELEMGDAVYLNAGPENGCQLNVLETSAGVGLNASAWSGMSGPPSTRQAFIPATISPH